MVERIVRRHLLSQPEIRSSGLVLARNTEDRKGAIGEATRIFVVIPTVGRPTQLGEALSSVYNQTFRPHLTIVVGEGKEDFDHLPKTGLSAVNSSATLYSLNRRTANLSGAVNTGIMLILDREPPTEASYVAILDDDDWWEPTYLERCLSVAREGNLDWIVAGIRRHESEAGQGLKLSIPCVLSASAFLRSNPHVQGSNLFLRLSTLLEAGCFDENLQSTTDRDLGVRLANLGNVRVGFVSEHLVHHRAYARDRLSTPASPRKREGLVAFYQKYSPIMSSEDRAKFLERATTVFGCPTSDFGEGN